MEITKKKLFSIWLVINSFIEKSKVEKFSTHFSYGLSRNKAILLPEVQPIQESAKPSEKYLEFEKKRNDLLEELSDRDEEGAVMHNVNENGQKYYKITERKEEFDAAVAKLMEEYKETIDEFNKQEEEINKILEQTTEVNFYKMSLDVLPPDLPYNIVEVLDPLIKEPAAE